MSTSLVTPKIAKGAIIGVDLFNPLASVVVFQYNPDTLTRTLTPQTLGASPDRGEALRLKGPPEEKIKLDIDLDATDDMERGGGATGVYGPLSALEMLVYPKSALVIANEVLATLGVIEIIPPEAPLTFFVWGNLRIVPVRILEFSIIEEAFDANLVPIRAKVSLGLRVLNYNDLGLTHPGGAIFMAHQIAKEVLATSSSAGAISSAVSSALGI
jgi:hypothetical protein